MGLLTSAAQMIVGPKTFQHDTVFKGKVRFEKEITRTREAAFKLDKSTDVDVGMPKIITPRIEIVTNANPGAAGAITVSVAAYVPMGTKAIEGWFQMSSSVAGDYLAVRETGGTLDCDVCRCQVANVVSDGHFFILLDANRTFDYYASHANIHSVYFRFWIYYL